MFDFFGYVPQFRIKGKESFTSKFGGFTFLVFVLITMGFIVYQVYFFVITLETVKSCLAIYQKNQDLYRMTTQDVYFGISLRDSKGNVYLPSKFPYFDFTFSIVNKTGNNANKTEYPLGECDINYFYNPADQRDLSNLESIKYFVNNNYRCPINFNSSMSSSMYKSTNYFSIKINVKEKFRNLTNIKNILQDLGLEVSFIYSNSYFNSINKTVPYFSQIEEQRIKLQSSLSRTDYYDVNPLETKDSGLIPSNGYEYFKSKIFSNQINGTVFQIIHRENSVKLVDTYLNTPKILDIQLKLTNLKTQNLRTFKNIQDLLSIIGSFLPNSYLVFLVIANTINQVKGKNSLMGAIYSPEIILKLKDFHKNHHFRRSAMRKTSFIHLPSFRYFGENNFELEDKIQSKDNSDNSVVSENNEPIEKHNGDWNLNKIFEIDNTFKFSFIGYIKSLVFDDQPKFIKSAYNNFHDAIEIDSYLFLNQEFDFFKDLFFDENQRMVFEMASKYRNLRNLFKAEKINKITIHQAISTVYERRNKKDRILIEYLENNLEIRKSQ